MPHPSPGVRTSRAPSWSRLRVAADARDIVPIRGKFYAVSRSIVKQFRRPTVLNGASVLPMPRRCWRSYLAGEPPSAARNPLNIAASRLALLYNFSGITPASPPPYHSTKADDFVLPNPLAVAFFEHLNPFNHVRNDARNHAAEDTTRFPVPSIWDIASGCDRANRLHFPLFPLRPMPEAAGHQAPRWPRARGEPSCALPRPATAC